MPVTTCYKCGWKPISTSAETCPKCGLLRPWDHEGYRKTEGERVAAEAKREEEEMLLAAEMQRKSAEALIDVSRTYDTRNRDQAEATECVCQDCGHKYRLIDIVGKPCRNCGSKIVVQCEVQYYNIVLSKGYFEDAILSKCNDIAVDIERQNGVWMPVCEYHHNNLVCGVCNNKGNRFDSSLIYSPLASGAISKDKAYYSKITYEVEAHEYDLPVCIHMEHRRNKHKNEHYCNALKKLDDEQREREAEAERKCKAAGIREREAAAKREREAAAKREREAAAKREREEVAHRKRMLEQRMAEGLCVHCGVRLGWWRRLIAEEHGHKCKACSTTR